MKGIAQSELRAKLVRDGIRWRAFGRQFNSGLLDLGFTRNDALTIYADFGLPGPGEVERTEWVGRVHTDARWSAVDPDNLKLLLDFLSEMLPVLLEMCPQS